MAQKNAVPPGMLTGKRRLALGSQMPRPGPSDPQESNRRQTVTEVRGAIPNPNAFIFGYNRPQWLKKVFTLWQTTYDHINKPYDSQLDAIDRVYPRTSSKLGADSWVRSVNQVSIPRNVFVWHDVPELANLPVAGGNPQSVQQQYVMIKTSQALEQGLLAARSAVPHAPAAYNQSLVTYNQNTNTYVVNRAVASLPGMGISISEQAQSGSRFFQWIQSLIDKGQVG